MRHNLLIFFILNLGLQVAYAQSFVHPGLLNSKEDLDRMRTGVLKKTEPILSGYQVFSEDPQSKYDYKMLGPLAAVSRNPTVGQGAYDSDANAAYQNAVMWCITGDKRYAEKSKEIINAWSSTLKGISGKDAVLMAGLGPFKMINAAEIIRYTNAAWPESDILNAERCFKEIVYPVLKNFAPFANGNWDSAALKTMMAIAIFCNDRPMYERALQYYVAGDGDGAVTHYIVNDEGQCQESGRDQAHTQLGIAHLGDCCEMAWHQGLDLYGYAGNKLLKGFEYTARYNLGLEVPYAAEMDRTGKYEHKVISPDSRGRLRPVYEQIYNHYAILKQEPAPFTQQAAEKIRPELKGQPGADHPGFGTLLYSVPSQNSASPDWGTPAMPGGLTASGKGTEIALTWVSVVGALNYIVERSVVSSGPYSIVLASGTSPYFLDKNVKAGSLYYYKVIAANKNGRSKASLPVAVCAGLPKNWKCDGGNLPPATCNYDGSTFTIDAAGVADTDKLQGAFMDIAGNTEIIARFNPPVASQFARFGLILQDKDKSEFPFVSILIRPRSTKEIEMPVWEIVFSTKSAGDTPTVTIGSQALGAPYVSWGRLMEPCWFKLARNANDVTAFYSGDGHSWTAIGSAHIFLGNNPCVGIVANSGIKNVSSKVQFDHVSVRLLN